MIGVSHTKKLKHATSFYKNSFGYHPPYLIICDSNFIFAALDNKINLEQQFTEIFKGKVYLKVTSCTYNEINKLKGKEFEEMKKFAKEGCQRFKCNHPVKPVYSCILDSLSHGFIGGVATQDEKLRRTIHGKYPKIAVFFVNRTLQIVKPPQSLREKVNQELIEKYSPKHLSKEDKDVDQKDEDKDVEQKDEDKEAKQKEDEKNDDTNKENE